MTLLLAARAKSHIVLTADGRCIKTTNGQRSIGSDTLQKIFPAASRPLAIAHHGQNIIENKSIADVWKIFYQKTPT